MYTEKRRSFHPTSHNKHIFKLDFRAHPLFSAPQKNTFPTPCKQYKDALIIPFQQQQASISSQEILQI